MQLLLMSEGVIMQVHQEKKRMKFRVSFIFLFIIASFVACFALYMREDFDVAVPTMQNVDESAVNEESNDYTADKTVVNPVPQSERADDTYFNTAAFIVLNNMSGLADYKVVPRENMLCGDFLIKNICSDEYGTNAFLQEESYDSYYIEVGMNDLDSINDSDLFDGLKQLAETICSVNPNADIYLISLIPVTAANETEDVTNVKISAFNSALLKFATENNLFYLDLNTYFVGNDGKLPESKSEKIGDRLKRDTYIEIGEYILTHIGEYSA